MHHCNSVGNVCMKTFRLIIDVLQYYYTVCDKGVIFHVSVFCPKGGIFQLLIPSWTPLPIIPCLPLITYCCSSGGLFKQISRSLSPLREVLFLIWHSFPVYGFPVYDPGLFISLRFYTAYLCYPASFDWITAVLFAACPDPLPVVCLRVCSALYIPVASIWPSPVC